MSNIHPMFTDVLFADGSVISPPVIKVGDGGHVYRPEGFEDTSGKKHITFGRGYRARDEAESIVSTRIADQIKTKIDSGVAITKLVNSPGTVRGYSHSSQGYGPGFAVYYNHPIWGMMSVGISRASTTRSAVFVETQLPAIHSNIVDPQRIYSRGRWPVNHKQEITQGDPTETLMKFKNNPLDEAFEVPEKQLFGDIPVPDEWNPSYRNELAIGQYQFHSLNYAHYLSSKALKRVVIENMEGLTELGRALSTTGASFDVRSDVVWNEDRQRVNKLRSIAIMIPISNKEGQQHRHTIHFDERGISVNCGYIEDEQNAIDYQKRHIMDALQEISTPEWEEETYQIGKENT